MATNRIKELRNKKGLSQAHLADELGISNQIISFYENDKREPKIGMWQKLADFFGVSVPYLQGIEPDFSKVTKQTKTTISLILNNYYFGYKNNNYSLIYKVGKEVFDITNLSEKEWKNYFSSSKHCISMSESRKLYDYVNKYFELTGKKIRLFTTVDAIIDYWMKELNFVLQDERLIRSINNRLFRYSKKESMTAGQLVSACNVFATRINKSIYGKIVDDFSTDLGKYINYGKYNDELSILESNFRLSLRTAGSIKSMRKVVESYEGALNSLIDKVQLDETNGKLAEYVKKNKNLEQMSKEINELYKEFDELYSKDSEFKTFAENYEKEHPIGIKIVDKTGRIIGSNSISKKNKLLSLYLYKHEKGENTTKLYELLIKRGILY